MHIIPARIHASIGYLLAFVLTAPPWPFGFDDIDSAPVRPITATPAACRSS